MNIFLRNSFYVNYIEFTEVIGNEFNKFRDYLVFPIVIRF
ncbi:hypothetical protein LEP1GSC061_1039 [Leptospira wolffii serovar Khorat str. Khorat-H2]|nr:hypothetical protein LEP1GSC061_1039 [Leptospira wolffii serovar Khorat str. Khorat-H2]